MQKAISVSSRQHCSQMIQKRETPSQTPSQQLSETGMKEKS